MLTIKGTDRNLYLLYCKKLEVERELEENPGLTTAECGRIAAIQRQQEGLQRQIRWWKDQRSVQQLVAKFNGHDEPARSIPVSDFLGPKRLNGSVQRQRHRNRNQFVQSAVDLKRRTGRIAGLKEGGEGERSAAGQEVPRRLIPSPRNFRKKVVRRMK